MWIKICGITNTDDAEMVADSGADAIGLNFYAPSKRYIAIAIARDIRERLGRRTELVGVFVNSTAEKVAEIARIVSLDTVQFHGDESADMIADFQRLAGNNIGIIRAFRVGPNGFAAVDDALNELTDAGVQLKAVLLDAYMPGEYGGTGHQIAPHLARDWIKTSINAPPVILAGGLTPENIQQAVSIAHPWGIDTASGVEVAPGEKCEKKLRLFVHRARSAQD